MSDTASNPTGAASPSGERRQVTVLFADMVGFTSISEKLGEEGTFTLIQPIYELMAAAVLEHGGSVKDFTGDGIMALFGAPESLEDAPLRACRAGLAIHERLAVAAPAIGARHGVRPQMRIGINSGLAVVTHIRSESAAMTALGDTVNLASRLQSLAEPGTVYLSRATQRLIQGMAETTFVGSHPIKGKAESQSVYRLDALRKGATRFQAAIDRGLTTYIGRERELELLEQAWADARATVRVVDIVAEPGMGKSRLIYEFRQRIRKQQAFFLSGSCSPEGRQTPFLPFIEVVRGSFQVQIGEPEAKTARKLELGLGVLGLLSGENFGLLLHLLGHAPQEGSLAGLDGVLIGLRTRDLLQDLLEARCRLTPVVMVIEDLHWIDSASLEVLSKIVESETTLRLLVLHTRRPERELAWLGKPRVTPLKLEPLPAGDVRRLIQTRIGTENLPEALARQVTDKAEGNALFAEEILSFLAERGLLRSAAGKVEFEVDAAAGALPTSLQSLLTARVDRLAPRNRSLLQAAAVIGRRFDARLLAVVSDDSRNIETQVAAMRALGLVHPEGVSGDYAFGHVLMRDALYQSLLAGPRAALHLRIAEEIERRNGNRLTEVVETLAYHYSQTGLNEKTFHYLAQAGNKSLSVYSFEEADKYFGAAIATLDASPCCASDIQIAGLLVDYTLFLNLAVRLRPIIDTVQKLASRLANIGDDPAIVQIYHQYVLALLWSGSYVEARVAQKSLSEMAARLQDPRSVAYALASEIHVATVTAPYTAAEFEDASGRAMAACSLVEDRYLRYFLSFVISWEEFHRGHMLRANEIADESISIGRRENDPRSVGFGFSVKSWIATISFNHPEALEFSEEALRNSCTPFDEIGAETAKISSYVFLRRPEGYFLCIEFLEKCAANGWHWRTTAIDALVGVALVSRGEIRRGLDQIEKASDRLERQGQRSAAEWSSAFIAEIYLEIVSGKEKLCIKDFVLNFITLVKVWFRAERRIVGIVNRIRHNPQVDPNGFHIGRCEAVLGLFYKIKKDNSRAAKHLNAARLIISKSGPSPILTKIETALAELHEIGYAPRECRPP